MNYSLPLLAAACFAMPLIPARADSNVPELEWLSDYTEAHATAKTAQKHLLVYFHGAKVDDYRRQFEADTLIDSQVRRRLQDYVLLKQPLDEPDTDSQRNPELQGRPPSDWLQGRQGLAILDLKHEGAAHYDRVVSYLPFVSPVYYAKAYHGVASVRALLDLPAGTITQRTMVYAIRMHPERPASSKGSAEPFLMQQCAGHCTHQAKIQRQGHHNWNSRFHRIVAQLGGRPATEVCAESWPGKELLDASLDCVYSWRQSSGHWNAVRRSHSLYGYDIRRGGNRIWYATGIFAD